MGEDKITLYTTHCPKCKVLAMKLNSKNIAFDECDDVEEMRRLGYQFAPLLRVGDKVMDFTQAIQWVNRSV